MRTFKIHAPSNSGPEAKIQNAIIEFLRSREWFCKVMIGNSFQFGVPDLFTAHAKHGQRWIEVKNPLAYSFTPAQLTEFPKMVAAGVGIWVLFSSDVNEMEKLFKPANWFEVFFKWSNGAGKAVRG